MSRQVPTLTYRGRRTWGATVRRWPGGKWLTRIVVTTQSLVSPVKAATLRLERSARAELLQPATNTWTNRHPLLFAATASHLDDLARPRLLSFGCSTGQEVFTLARHLPGAQIDAVDINPACIARARRDARRRSDWAAINFVCASRPDPTRKAYYDAVLCLSVLRHGRLEAELPESCDDIMPFERFAATINQLDRALRPGGLLVLWGCHFRFADTSVARRYRVLSVSGAPPQAAPFYGPDDSRLIVRSYADFLFQKISEASDT
ncbi:class I SAM-dependent methyltransferase [Sphingomonas sp. M1A8_2b]